MNDDYSQAGQDKFVMSLIKNPVSQPYFLDIGCHLPRHLNNTLLLEENGWFGVSIDILDFQKEWATRHTPFIMGNALTLNYKWILDHFSIPNVIDYLNIDIEGEGLRFQVLKKVFESNREFKVITIEHDRYRGYYESEVKTQRDFLVEMEYECICEDVCATGNPFEDWWINPKYFKDVNYQHLYSVNEDYKEILKKIK